MKKIMRFFNNKFFLAICAGVLINLAFAPLNFFPAVFISLSLFYFLLEKKHSNKTVFFIGWCYGFGYFLAGVYWISIALLVDAQSFAWLIPFALTLIPAALALYFAMMALSYNFLVKKFSLSKNYEKFLILASCWLIFEILRSFLFTGFPWNLLGYVWMFNDSLTQAASLFGAWGLSFFAVLISLLPILFFCERSKGDKIFFVVMVALLIMSFVYGNWRIKDEKILSDKNIKLRLVQGNIKQEMKWNQNQKYLNLIKQINLTNQKETSDIAAVIWSETSVPYAIDENSELIQKLQLAVPKQKDGKGILITGALRLKYVNDEISNVWNSVFLIGNQGIIASYDKHHLVPFGEYVPLQKYLPFINKITDGAIGFSQGLGPQTIHSDSFSFSPLLCYEVIFSDEIINQQDRPDLLVNLTNDSWFGNSSGPYQHFDMARMRAVEYGIPLARVASTGITAFFDPFGRVVNQINLNQEGIIDVELVKKLEPTIYSRYYCATLLLLVSLLVTFLYHKKNVIRQNYTS
ncbi:MAG: apolipoprotein N-acyltransferase [Proteobacteria bacterium]|nr:apolipoprotein N-acyltransferase [Pseudomonadota bacterium]